MGIGNDATRRVVVQFVAEDNNLAATVVSLDGRVRDLKGRFVSLDGAVDAFGRSAKMSGAQASSAFARVSTAAKAARDDVRGMVSSAKGVAAGIKSFGLLGIGLDAIAGAAVAAARAIDDWATESLEAQRIATNLAFSIDAAAESTKGFVDNVTLGRNANRAFALGVAKDSKEFAVLAGATTAIAEQTGANAQKLLEQATLGISRKSAARLDDLNIILTQSSAEKDYAKKLGVTAKQLTLLQKDEAFQAVALDKIKVAGDQAARSMDGFAVKVAKTKVELQNAKSSLQGFSDDTGKVREALRQVTDEQLERLRFGEVADDASAAGKEMNAFLAEWSIGLRDVRGQADKLGVTYKALIEGASEARDVAAVERIIKNQNLQNAEQVRLMREQADATEFQADLIRAGAGDEKLANEFTREAVELRRSAAELAGETNKELKISRELALLTAKDAAGSRGGGGGGPSRADRVRAAGGGAVQDLEHMASLQAAIAVSAQEVFEAEEASRGARQAALDLERAALEVTRARGKSAKEELATELAATDQQAGLLVLEGRVAAREREAAAVTELRTIEQARNTMRSEEAANVVSLETFKLGAMADQLETQGQLSAAAGVRQQQLAAEAEFAAIQFAAREVELALRPPETEIERIEQKGELQQLEHDRELARIEQDGAARAAHDGELDRLAKAEAKRKKAAMAQTKAIAGATRSVMSQGQAFAGRVLDAAGVDGEKRAKIDQQIGAVSAFVTGAISTVKGVAAAASSNPVSAAAHFASAAFAIGTGVAMLAGNVQGAAGGGSAAAPGPEPRAERETSEAARIPDSVPAADREPSQRFGADPRGGAGGTVINIGNINANGAIDDEFAENMATALDNQQFKRGA